MLRDLFSLFPAYAGVILAVRFVRLAFAPFPRIRGGDPQSLKFAASQDRFSPHTRGLPKDPSQGFA